MKWLRQRSGSAATTARGCAGNFQGSRQPPPAAGPAAPPPAHFLKDSVAPRNRAAVVSEKRSSAWTSPHRSEAPQALRDGQRVIPSSEFRIASPQSLAHPL